MTLKDTEIVSKFFAILGYNTHLKSEFTLKLLEIDQDNMHSAYKIKLMLSRVS